MSIQEGHEHGLRTIYVVGWAYTDQEGHEDGCGPADFDVISAYDGPDAQANALAYAETRRVIEHAALSDEERAIEVEENACDCGPEILKVPIYDNADGPRPPTRTEAMAAAMGKMAEAASRFDN